MNRNFKVVISSQYESTCFPGKPLADLNGKPMLQYVYESAVAAGAEEVVVATDSTLVGMAAEEFGATVCMTLEEYNSGMDQLCEVVDKLGWTEDTVVVNLQCDEPLTPSDIIKQVAINLFDHEDAHCSTLCVPIESAEEIEDSNIVKLITDSNGNAMYFSRSIMPFRGHIEDASAVSLWNRHIAIFSYRVGLLQVYKDFPVCDIEKAEKFEPLRILWNGIRINVATATNLPGSAVHTPDDLEKVKLELKILKENVTAGDVPE